MAVVKIFVMDRLSVYLNNDYKIKVKTYDVYCNQKRHNYWCATVKRAVSW